MLNILAALELLFLSLCSYIELCLLGTKIPVTLLYPEFAVGLLESSPSSVVAENINEGAPSQPVDSR